MITGRRAEDVATRLGVPHVRYVGLYGLEDDAPELVAAVVPLAERAAAIVPEAWVEDKGVSIAVHYRRAPDPAGARGELVVAMQDVATEAGLGLVEGKMVVELVPRGRPMKGGAVERLIGELGLRAALYAGDDHADLDAFAALDRLGVGGVTAIKVAVRGPETPSELVAAADVVVDGPTGLVGLLSELALD